MSIKLRLEQVMGKDGDATLLETLNNISVSAYDDSEVRGLIGEALEQTYLKTLTNRTNFNVGHYDVVADGETAITVPFSYRVGGNMLVMLNGMIQVKGTDYTETDETNVTFSTDYLVAGDKVTFIETVEEEIGNYSSEFSYDTEGEIKSLLILGERNVCQSFTYNVDGKKATEQTIEGGEATAGAPSLVGTGDGTLVVNSVANVLPNESITLTCSNADVVGSEVFDVVSDVRGNLGQATTGVTYDKQGLNLDITAGATNFVVSDQFSVVITRTNGTVISKSYTYDASGRMAKVTTTKA